VCCRVLRYVAVCCNVLQCDAVCCSVLQCVAVCCSVLQCVALTDSQEERFVGCIVELFDVIAAHNAREFLHRMLPAQMLLKRIWVG